MNAITYHQCANCMERSIFRLDEFNEAYTQCPVCESVYWRDDLDMLDDEWEETDW